MVTIVVCVHNALFHLKECLKSVIKHTSIPYTLLIIDDASDIDTYIFLNELCDKKSFTLIRNNKRLGYTKSVNKGIKMVKSEYLILLNSDTVVTENWLQKMKMKFEVDEKIGLVGPISNAAAFQSIPFVYDKNGFFKVNSLPKNMSLDNFSRNCELIADKKLIDVCFLNGFCVMIKKTVIDKVGFFDDKLFPFGYGEEIDFCLRAKDSGFSLKVAPNTFVYHHKSKSFGISNRDKLAKEGRKANYLKYGKKHLDKIYSSLREDVQLSLIRSEINEKLYKN